jgi:hypothetical protein
MDIGNCFRFYYDVSWRHTSENRTLHIYFRDNLRYSDYFKFNKCIYITNIKDMNKV